MEEFNNAGGFFDEEQIELKELPGNNVDSEAHDYDSDPETLNRKDIVVPQITDAIKRSLKKQVYIPISLRMFNQSVSCPDDIFFINGLFFKSVCVVGRIAEIKTSSKCQKLTINDNWGISEVVIMYRDYESQPLWSKRIKESEYWKFYGQASIFSDKKSINITSGRKIVDFNEMTNHFLTIHLNGLIRKHGILSSNELKEGKRYLSKSMEDTHDTEEKEEECPKSTKKKFTPEHSSEIAIKQQLDEMIVKTIEEICEDEKSADVNEIYNKLPLKVQRSKFDEAIGQLTNEMVILSHDGNFSFVVT